jgi:hypothetical protein
VVDEVVVDERDAAPEVDLPTLTTNTMLNTPERSQELAREIIGWQ